MRPAFTLKRIFTGDDGTFGVLLDKGGPFAVTLEDPWRNNEPFRSCIPHGMYVCRRVNSPKFGSTFEITAVPGRTHILFHRGNTEAQTQGCVLVGEQYEPLDGHLAILNSGKGYKEFMDKLEGHDECVIEIRWSA